MLEAKSLWLDLAVKCRFIVFFFFFFFSSLDFSWFYIESIFICIAPSLVLGYICISY